jgi:hypothetical protein
MKAFGTAVDQVLFHRKNWYVICVLFFDIGQVFKLRLIVGLL